MTAKTKQTSYRMPLDILRELEVAAKVVGMDKTELLCRLARYGLRKITKDSADNNAFLLSQDAVQELPVSQTIDNPMT